MQCGLLLPQQSEEPSVQTSPAGRYNMFLLSIAGSIGLSLILVYVFKLPIFFLAGFLPLLWPKRK